MIRLGLLVGVFEALIIVRWDWIMDDVRPGRLVTGLAWTLTILALNAGLWGLLGRLCKGSAVAAGALFLAAVYGARWLGEDRFYLESLWCIAPALALAAACRPGFGFRERHRIEGLLAVALALPALWGRIPNFTLPLVEQLLFLTPAALVTCGLGAWKTRLARVGLGLAGVASLLLGSPTGVAEQAGNAYSANTNEGSANATVHQSSGPSDTPPNVLFILVDTLRQDHVGGYQGAQDTPSTQRLAAEGVRFADAITVIPKTTQSVAAFQTGNYPVTSGVRILRDVLPAEQHTLAERLREQGYHTGAVVHNGWVMRGRGYEQGFDQFWTFFEIEKVWGPLQWTGWGTALDGLTIRKVRHFDGDTDAQVATERALDWLDAAPEPFFLYVHYFDPHWPYRPPGEDDDCLVNDIKGSGITRGEMMFQDAIPQAEDERASALYAGEVVYNLDHVGRLLDALDAQGLTENTLVVFTSDHGHHLGDHDYAYHHGEFLYEPGVQIPLLMRLPGQIEAGQVVEQQVASIDVAPTVLDLLGLESSELDGQPQLGSSATSERPIFLETDISYFRANTRRHVKGVLGKVRGVRKGRWKLHYTPRKGRGLWELYDLQNDPGELHELIAAEQAPPAVLRELLDELARRLTPTERAELEAIGNRFDRLPRAGRPKASETVTEPLPETDAPEDEALDPAEREMLRALGYVE